MKLPLNWVRDYANIVTTPHEYAEKMTMSGSKVEGYACEADGIKNVVIGKILSLDRHPDSDHLWVCQVDVGAGAPVQIVTGAQNLKVGDLCPAALDGAVLPGGKTIAAGKLRGVESNGMLCSLGELGLTTHDFPHAIEDGIMVLDEDAVPGTPAVKALGMDDVTVEFEITPNRPDCLSVRGLARESAATYGVPFVDHVPALPQGEGDIKELLSVTVTAPVCSRYVAAMVTNVRVKPSPRWMRERLRLCGVRPINNIVDITNYVMLEYGHPMHAFDYAYVGGGKINVRMARPGEKIMTLDGVERPLDETMMVIADDKVPMAVAGVMGGEFSGIYDSTKNIVFEGACFDGPSVRVTAKKIGLRTEASGRFEKGLNPENCLPAIKRALELVVELDAGDVIGGVIDVYPQPRGERRIPLRPETINRLLGTAVPVEQMLDILRPLGFGIEKHPLTALAEGAQSPYVIVVPPDRYDVERDCDLAEEVCRYVGYNKVPSTIMKGVATASLTDKQKFHDRLAEALVGYGLYECETFSFYSRKAFDSINLPANDPLRSCVVISNPLGEDTSIMRTTAVPSMMDVVARNVNARAPEAALFEDATEYIPNDDPDKLPAENEKFILAVYGGSWDYLALKGVVEKLLLTARITGVAVVPNTAGTTYHPGRAADLMIGEEKIATIGEIHPKVLANYGIKPRVCVADVSFDALWAHRGATPQFCPLPKHPAITRDLALVAAESVPAAAIAACIERGAGKVLESLSLFDIYRGENIGTGNKSLAYNLVMRTADRTMTDVDADDAVARILEDLKEIGVTLRS